MRHHILYRFFPRLSTPFRKKSGVDLGALPQTPPKPFLEERFRNPKNFTEKGIPPTEAPEKFCVPLIGGMPFSVKVLGVLRPFFQEGSKQGLGQSPKVFPGFFYEKGLTNGGKCAMIKVRGNASDGCSLG